MYFIRNRFNIAADSIVIRRWNKDRIRLLVFVQTLCDFLCADSAKDSKFIYNLRIYIHRRDVRKRQCIENRLMAVPCHYKFFPPAYRREDCRNQTSGTSVYQKVRFFYIIKLPVFFHRFGDDAFGLKQIVRSRNFRNIAVHDDIQKLSVAVFAVNPRAFVPRHVKGYRLKLRMFFQKLSDSLIQRSLSPPRIHFLPIRPHASDSALLQYPLKYQCSRKGTFCQVVSQKP